MRRTMRAVLAVTLMAVLVMDPVTACHYGGGYYYGNSASCGGYYEPAGCSGGYYAYEVADCGTCGCGYDNCGSCGCDGEVVHDGPSYEPAPGAIYDAPPEPMDGRSGSADVRRPVDQMPAPALRDEPMPQATTPAQPSPPQATTTPAAPPQDTTPAADDLFGPTDEPMDQPADDMFAPAEPAPTSDEPVATSPPAPAEDDRYAPPAEPAADNMFGPLDEQPTPPQETEAPASEPADDSDFDSLFGAPDDAAPPADEEPAEEEPAPSEDEDNLFNFGQILSEPGGLASNSLRRWVDNTGNYSCRGRLIRMLDGKVQLLKESGRTTTVPLNRLSQSDLEFVHRQASAQRAEAVGQTAQLTLPSTR